MSNLVVELSEPIPRPSTVEGMTSALELVELRRPKARDLIGIDWRDHTTAMIVLIHKCSELTVEEVLNLDAGDYMKMQMFMHQILTVQQ